MKPGDRAWVAMSAMLAGNIAADQRVATVVVLAGMVAVLVWGWVRQALKDDRDGDGGV